MRMWLWHYWIFRNELKAPQVPGRAIAWLALHGPRNSAGNLPEANKAHFEARCYFSNSAIRSAWFATRFIHALSSFSLISAS